MDGNKKKLGAFFSSIPDIAAFRDEDKIFRDSKDRISELKHDSTLDNWDGVETLVEKYPFTKKGSKMRDKFFSNSPLYGTTDSQGNKYSAIGGRLVSDLGGPSGFIEGATRAEAFVAEMEELAKRERNNTASEGELELLNAYREFFTARTGMAKGGLATKGVDEQTRLAFDVVEPPPVEEWAQPFEPKKDTMFDTATSISAPGFREAWERVKKAGTRDGVAGSFPKPNSRLEQAYQHSLGYFADMGLAGLEAADAAMKFAIGVGTEFVPGQDPDEERRLARDIYGMTEAAMGNPAGAARAVDDVVESAGRMGQQVPAFMAAEEGAIKVPRFRERASETSRQTNPNLPDAKFGLSTLGDIFFDQAGGLLSDGTPLSYAPNITLHDAADIVLGRKTPEEVLDYYGNDPSPELLDYLDYRIEGLKGLTDFEEYVKRYSQLNSPYDPWDHIGLFEPKTEQPSGITVFRSAIPEVIDQITFPEQGIKGSQLLKEIQDSPSIRMSEWRSLGVDIDPQKRYSKDEVNELVNNNLWEVKAVPENRWKGYQRQKDLQDKEKDYFEFAIDATRQGPTFQAKGQHFGGETLAHVRASVREGQQGDYILVEELQSDLLQQGFESPRKARPFSDIVEEFKGEVESYRNDLESIIQDDFDDEDLDTISIAKVDPNDLKNNNYARYAKILEIIPAEELQKSLPNGSDLSNSQGLLLKYSEKLPEEISANDIRVVLSNLRRKEYVNKSVSEPPIAKTEEGVRLAFDALIDKAVKEGLDKIVIPPFERIVERRFEVGTESYENALKPISGFYATYIKSVNKVLKEYEQEFGKENFSYRLEPLNYPSPEGTPLFDSEKLQNLDLELSMSLGDLNKTSFNSWGDYLDNGFMRDYITYNTSPSGEIYFPETGRDTTIRSVEGFLPDLQSMAERAVNEKVMPSGLSVEEFESVLDTTSENGLGFAKLENALFREGFMPLSELKATSDAPDLPTEGLVIDISKLKDTPYDFSSPKFNQGGLATKGVDDQMRQIFAEGGITTDGMKKDPVSGNEVPPGSLAEEVRDDVPARLSTGEYVVPADVVRYFGVAYFEKLRKKAKEGLGEMEADGRIGGEPEDDDFPFSEDELEFEDDLEMAEGGVVMGQPNPQAFSAPSNPMFDRGQFSMGTVQQGIESRRYINPQTGEQRSFTFINGQPVGAIPQGFVPYTEELAAQTTKAPVASPTEGLRPTLQDGTERGPGRTQEERDQRAGTSEDRVGGGFGASNYDELTQDPLGFAKKALDPTFIDRGIVGGAALFAGPIAGLGVKEGIKLENIAQANAAKQIAESQGLDTTEIDRLIEGAVKGLSGVAKRLYEADRVATGQNYAQSYFEESAKRTPATLQTPSVPTAAGITTSRLAPSTPSTPTSGYTLTGSDIDYLRTQGVSSANTALPGDKATPQETTALAMSYGPQRPVTPAPSPAPVTGGQKTQEERNAGQTSRPSTGEAQTLRFGDTRSEGFGDWALSGISSGPGRTQEERDARGGDSVGGGRTGSPRGGRATGGLVDKPQKHKTKSRRKIKTVEK